MCRWRKTAEETHNKGRGDNKRKKYVFPKKNTYERSKHVGAKKGIKVLIKQEQRLDGVRWKDAERVSK